MSNSPDPDRCKVMHVGHNHPTEYYIRQDSKLCKLAEVTEKRTLALLNTNCDLKSDRQCTEAAKKATTAPRLIKRHFYDINNSYIKISRYSTRRWSAHISGTVYRFGLPT